MIIFSERVVLRCWPNDVVAFVGHNVYLFVSLKLPIITPRHRFSFLHSSLASLSVLNSPPIGLQSVLERFWKSYSEIFIDLNNLLVKFQIQ